MKTLNYLNSKLQWGKTSEEALASLTEQYGIKVTIHENTKLIVLNYNQITSPKFNDVVKECRSLVLEYDTESNKFLSVSRAFDRFFNYGEEKVPHKVENLIATEKLDGSLITVFYYQGIWYYRTKSMIMPTLLINNLTVTWKEVIEEALGDLYEDNLDLADHSFIFELTSPENRVVTRYQGRKMTLLAIRHNVTGVYQSIQVCDSYACEFHWGRPNSWHFDNWESTLKASRDLRDLQEGFVMYNRAGVPVSKVKNPAYVAAHHLRGDSALSPKRVVDLILMNEVDEYLALFPEDACTFKPYQVALMHLLMAAGNTWSLVSDIEDQKSFAMMVKDFLYSSLMFSLKKGLTFEEAWGKITRGTKQQWIEYYLDSNVNQSSLKIKSTFTPKG